MQWLVALSLLLAVGRTAKDQRAEKQLLVEASPAQLLGTWYINRWTGIVPIPWKKRLEPLPPFSFVNNGYWRLELRMHILKPSGCHLFKMPFEALVSSPGKYITWWKHLIYIWLFPRTAYGIAFFEDKINNEKMVMMMLFGRTLDDDLRTLEMFKVVVRMKGLNVSEIVNPPHVDSCELGTRRVWRDLCGNQELGSPPLRACRRVSRWRTPGPAEPLQLLLGTFN